MSQYRLITPQTEGRALSQVVDVSTQIVAAALSRSDSQIGTSMYSEDRTLPPRSQQPIAWSTYLLTLHSQLSSHCWPRFSSM